MVKLLGKEKPKKVDKRPKTTSRTPLPPTPLPPLPHPPKLTNIIELVKETKEYMTKRFVAKVQGHHCATFEQKKTKKSL